MVSAKLIVCAPLVRPVPIKVQVCGEPASVEPPVLVTVIEPEPSASLLVIETVDVVLLITALVAGVTGVWVGAVLSKVIPVFVTVVEIFPATSVPEKAKL